MDFCSIASGSSGNCIFVGTEETSVLIDAGIAGRRVKAGLNKIDRRPEDVDAILVTHEHSDHISGLGVLSRRYGIPIYATPGTIRAIRGFKSLGEIDEGLYHVIRPDEEFTIRDLHVQPFTISHDAAQPVAYRIEDGKRAMAVATDMGCYSEYTVEHLTGLDGLLVESNHDLNMLQVGSYPYPLKMRIMGSLGHLSNLHAGRLLCEILHDHLQTIMLGHLSKENNYEALAYATVCSEITEGDNPYKAEDFRILVAKREEESPLIHL